jgi:hypothetical protein
VCEIYSVTLRVAHRLRVYEDRVLRRVGVTERCRRCVMRSFILCGVRKLLCGWSSQGGCYDRKHAKCMWELGSAYKILLENLKGDNTYDTQEETSQGLVTGSCVQDHKSSASINDYRTLEYLAVILSVCLSIYISVCLSIYPWRYSPCGPWPIFQHVNPITVVRTL